MPARFLIATLTLVIGLLASWLLFQTQEQLEDNEEPKKFVKKVLEYVPSNPISDRKKSSENSDRNTSFDPNAIPYERIVAFSSEEAYRNFLKKLGASGVRNKGSIDSLRAVRIGFDSLTDFDALELNPEDVEFNYPVLIPELREVKPQQGVVGFGNGALDYLGINRDNSGWGQGVKIAVIDTGIEPHLALNDNIQHINLVELDEGTSPNSHGTSVASLIAGQHPNMLGVAPQADLISVRVADETGVSSSFLLAQGITAAADAGAQLINISMGSSSDSTLVRQAVDYAIEQGAVIFASSGNDGTQQASYPAADPDVYSVGAIDANGTHLNFSNTDDNLAFTAPGLEVQAAFPGDNVTSFTGTSGAVAFPVGAVAAIMSESQQSISPQQAVVILQGHTNEAGLPGADNQFGIGIIDIGRAIDRNITGIVDVAVASQTYLLPTADSSASGLQVSVENRGTEPVFQSTVDIQIGNDYFPYTIQKLSPNERTVVTIPSGLGQLRADAQLEVSAQVNLQNGQSDMKSANDQRKEIVTIPNDDR
ncbi:MAG: S8 family serine peptidase [Akkermansiaceae bacterium]|nr:S8 family serine peptidase [Akkermansiaceae bacterium]